LAAPLDAGPRAPRSANCVISWSGIACVGSSSS